VPQTRPLRSSTFRLTLAYLGLFSLSAALILALVYMASTRFMERQARETIDDEVGWLRDQYLGAGLSGLRSAVAERAAAEPNRRAIFLLVDRRGRPLAGNIDGWPVVRTVGDGFAEFEVLVVEDPRRPPRAHLATAKILTLEDGGQLVVGRDVQDNVQTLRQMRTAILLGLGVIVVLGLGGGLVMSRWMLSRLERVNRATKRIMAGDFSQRIATEGDGNEFDELAQNLNLMLERIERLLIGLRQVTEDIAHDLRTPLTRMRSRIEVALMSAPSTADSRDLLEQTLQDADRLIDTFNALLAIARAEAGAQHGDWELLELAEVAGDVAELYEPLAEERGIALQLRAEPGARVLGHRQLVAQAIANVADNAVKYTPSGGTVTIATVAKPAPTVTVTDTGPGIPADKREHAKQRFVRLDAQRSTPGSGLGLSLAEAVAKLHDARLELTDNAPGLRVTLAFHAAPMVEADPPRRAAAA
jgi:signal transduction histidine kinase